MILPDLQRQPPSDRRRLLYWATIATGPGERGVVLGSRNDPPRPKATLRTRSSPGCALSRRIATHLELGRVAYVAVTRARRALHLVGSAST